MCVLFQLSWQLQTQIVKNRIISDSLLGNKLYFCSVFVYFGGKIAVSLKLNIVSHITGIKTESILYPWK